MRPAISVMMAAYNTQEYIQDAVESLLNQTFTDFELLIVNDGSTDGTEDILRALAAMDGRIRLATRPNAGIVPTRNELLGMAVGEFVAVLDSDDIAPPRRLETSIDYLRSHPDVLAVGGAMEVIDPEGAPLCVWPLKQTPSEIDEELMLGEGVAICHSAATIRREALAEIAGYRDLQDFPGQAEDLDMWLRLSERGPIVNLPDVLAHYRVRLSSASVSGADQQAAAAQVARSEARLRRKHSAAPSRERIARVDTKVDVLLRWGWWALGAGHANTARKHAMRALIEHPLSAKPWKLIICAVRGY